MSLLLAVVMTLGLAVPAWASEQEEILETNRMILLNENNQKLEIYSEDYINGDAKVCLIQNNNVIYEAYLDRSKNQVTNKDFQANEMNTIYYTPATTLETKAGGISTGFIKQGRITYNYYIQGMVAGQKYLDVAYNKITNPYATYNLAGKYKNTVDVIMFFVGTYGLITKSATAIVASVMEILDLTMGATDFVIPAFDVDATKITMEWKGSVGNKQIVKITGMKYEFDLSGKKHVEYERMYHGEDSYKNHDKSLANDLYISAWGSDQHDIVSWS